jgi:hypothetical protein
LSWEEVAEGTAELVLLVDDPDALIEGSFVHWVLFGLAPSRTALSEDEHPAEAGHGANGFGQPGYLGPAPPAGHGTITTSSGCWPLTSRSRSTASRATQKSRKQQQATLSPRLRSSAPTNPAGWLKAACHAVARGRRAAAAR